MCEYLQRYSQNLRPHGSWPFHDLTGTIPSFHLSVHEAMNGGMVFGGCSSGLHFWEQLVIKEPVAL